MKRLLFLLLFIFSIFLPVLSAESPTTKVSDTVQTGFIYPVGMNIIYPKLDYYKFGDIVELNFHLFDYNNTPLTNVSTECVIDVYNRTGEHILVQEPLNTQNSGLDFYIRLDKSNITEPGFYYYDLFCLHASGNYSQEGCFGNATNCSDMSVEDCENQQYCHLDTPCLGTVTNCTELDEKVLSYAMIPLCRDVGCLQDGDRCYGTVNCSIYTNISACQTSGISCMWYDGVCIPNGGIANCSFYSNVLNEGNCTHINGCSWNATASDCYGTTNYTCSDLPDTCSYNLSECFLGNYSCIDYVLLNCSDFLFEQYCIEQDGCFWSDGSQNNTFYRQFLSSGFKVTRTGEDNTPSTRQETSIILSCLLIAAFYIGIGLISKKLIPKFFSFGMAGIQALIIAFTVYSVELGSTVVRLLEINFWAYLITFFGIGMFTLYLAVQDMINPPKENEKSKKWE
jgi:hypothetical protein